ncbi:MAG: glycine--tRNA ligase subunit beta [Elusimicrobia bacterium]|nr:glycine--tRNA ligase subunit beta [Elusimicrobiota bacterium]
MGEKTDLLIEIGCEDLPPDNVAYINREGPAVFAGVLEANRLECRKLDLYVTPRRVAVRCAGISAAQQSIHEKIKGPPESVAVKDGKPTQAGSGFAKKLGVAFGDLKTEKTPKGNYLYYVKEVKGRMLSELVQDMLTAFLKGLSFPVTMRWPGCGIPFPRPIRWILAKSGKSALSVSLGDLKSSRTTRGHYVFADKKITLGIGDDYEKVLLNNYVIADCGKRKEYLVKAIDRVLKYKDAVPIKDEGLLDEVNNLLEFPTGVLGEFPEKYLKLPREVTEACLMHHQKYFPVEDADGNLANLFVGVRDGISEYLDPIRKGYERVLIARLEDADFFLKQDRAVPLEEYSGRLRGIEFTRGLGTLYDKAERITALSAIIAGTLGKSEEYISTVKRIAILSKADLVTHMVGEFPELEGKIGRIYAGMDGEKKEVCEGIFQHYQPRTFDDKVPGLEEAAVVGIADRADTLVGNMGSGVEATGSQDPFGMRRVCRGLMRILVEKKIDVNIDEIVKYGREEFLKGSIKFEDANMDKLREFMLLQMKNYLEEAYRHDVARCVAESGGLNPYRIFRKAAAVRKIKKSRGFDSLITAFKRINNILKQASEKGIAIPDSYDEGRLKDAAEKELSSLFGKCSLEVRRKIEADDFDGVLEMLASLRTAVDRFFDEVLVMDPDESVMKNRLALLKNMVMLFSPVGDISKLETKAG